MEQDRRTPAPAARSAERDIHEILGTIQDQTRESLELLRALVNQLLEQHALREGPPLEDLIATLVVQQREILTVARQTSADVRALRERLPGLGRAGSNGHARPNGRAPSC
jgi:hypothetical protein